MMGTKQHLYQTIFAHCGVVCMTVITLFAFGTDAIAATRGTSARVSTRGTVASRLPTTTSTLTSSTTVSSATTEAATEAPEPEPGPEPEPEIVIEDKTSQFDEFMEYENDAVDASADRLADMIAAQRAELDAQDEIAAARVNPTGNKSLCDVELRKCMQEKCGNDFTECAGDSDTTWGDKMDSCRNNMEANCSGDAYTKFAAEIKADRDFNAEMAAYNAILNCGNTYNDCIITECGTTFSKCLGKSAGDAAIAKCKTIAENCREQDSGLASRAMQVFANLRVDAEEQVKRDEERLYELRDDMSAQCQRLGATFDERTFSCVFTVEFYAGDDATLYASKKAYAGGVFDCTPNWFGIDVTTFMENAYRATREQSSATSGFMGAGIGVAAGAITSGAIDRAIDRTKAENAVRKAEKEHEKNYGDNGDTKTTGDETPQTTSDGDKKADGDEAPQTTSDGDKTGTEAPSEQPGSDQPLNQRKATGTRKQKETANEKTAVYTAQVSQRIQNDAAARHTEALNTIPRRDLGDSNSGNTDTGGGGTTNITE